MQNTTSVVHWIEEVYVADLPLFERLLAICQKSQEPSFWKVMDAFVLVAYASLAASRIHLQKLLGWRNFTLDSEDLFCWYIKIKKVISMNYGSTTWTHSQNSLVAAEAPSLKISSHGTSLNEMITNTTLINTRIVISYAMRQGIPFWVYWKVNGNWDNNMIRASQ